VTAAYVMSHAAAVGSGCMSRRRAPISTSDRSWHWRVSGDEYSASSGEAASIYGTK